MSLSVMRLRISVLCLLACLAPLAIQKAHGQPVPDGKSGPPTGEVKPHPGSTGPEHGKGAGPAGPPKNVLLGWFCKDVCTPGDKTNVITEIDVESVLGKSKKNLNDALGALTGLSIFEVVSAVADFGSEAALGEEGLKALVNAAGSGAASGTAHGTIDQAKEVIKKLHDAVANNTDQYVTVTVTCRKCIHDTCFKVWTQDHWTEQVKTEKIDPPQGLGTGTGVHEWAKGVFDITRKSIATHVKAEADKLCP